MLNRSSFKSEEFEHITPISVIIKKRQLALLGHILRREENDPERKPACDKDFIRTQAKQKRPYGPREHWWDANMKLAFEMISNEQNSETATFGPCETNPHFKNEYQTNNVQQHLAIANWAMDRHPPFGVGKKTLLQKEIRKEKREK